MKSRLYVVMTHYQLLIAIQMHRAIKLSGLEIVEDILITDYSAASEDIAKRVKQLSIFRRVGFARIKRFETEKSKVRNLKDIIQINFYKPGNNNYFLSCEGLDEDYNELFFYNNSPLIYALYDFYSAKCQVKLCRFEEGVFSYRDHNKDYSTWKKRISKILRSKKIVRRDEPLSMVHDFYCLLPSLYDNPFGYNIHKIPSIDKTNKDEIEQLNRIFDYSNDNEAISRFLFLASAEDLNRKPIGETKIIEEVIKKVGKENILIKKHPRDDRGYFEDLNIKTVKRSDIPWEIIQANIDCKGKIFITIASGSIIGASILLGEEIEGYLLFPMVKGNNTNFDYYCNNSVKYVLDRLHEKGKCNKIKIVDSIAGGHDNENGSFNTNKT